MVHQLSKTQGPMTKLGNRDDDSWWNYPWKSAFWRLSFNQCLGPRKQLNLPKSCMAYAINLLLLLQTLSLQQFSSLCHALSLLAGKAFCCTFRETQHLNSGTNVLHFLPLGCKERRGQLMTNGDNGNGNQRLHSFRAIKYWLCITQTQRVLIVGHWAHLFIGLPLQSEFAWLCWSIFRIWPEFLVKFSHNLQLTNTSSLVQSLLFSRGGTASVHN